MPHSLECGSVGAILPKSRPIGPSYSHTNMMDYRDMHISSWSASIDAVLKEVIKEKS